MKILALILGIALLTGCTELSTEQPEEQNATDSTPSATNPINVEEDVYTVDVTIAASFYDLGGGATQEVVDTAVEGNGFLAGVINSDGSVTFTMTKVQQETYLNELSLSIRNSLDDAASDYPEVISIKSNKDFTEFDVLVNAAAFKTFTRFIGIALALSASTYQMFGGNEDFKTTINYIDDSSGEVLDSTRFPLEED